MPAIPTALFLIITEAGISGVTVGAAREEGE